MRRNTLLCRRGVAEYVAYESVKVQQPDGSWQRESAYLILLFEECLDYPDEPFTHAQSCERKSPPTVYPFTAYMETVPFIKIFIVLHF